MPTARLQGQSGVFTHSASPEGATPNPHRGGLDSPGGQCWPSPTPRSPTKALGSTSDSFLSQGDPGPLEKGKLGSRWRPGLALSLPLDHGLFKVPPETLGIGESHLSCLLGASVGCCVWG